MDKWLLLSLMAISVETVSAMQRVKVAGPTPVLALGNHSILMVAGKQISPREPKKTNSPRKDLKNIMTGQMLPHKLLVRAESERRLLSLVDLKTINEADIHPAQVKLSKSNSGSSSFLKNSKSKTELSEEPELENSELVPTVILRRNTISS